jgi:ATP-dependent helicase/nuclease subunit B
LNVLHVVPGDRHVERLARDGQRAETWASLRARLAAALLPDVAFADPRTCRLVLAMALAEAPGARARQMDLFAQAAAAAGTDEDPLLAAVRGRGGASWARLVGALDDALSLLRARGATVAHLRRTADRGVGVASARARTIAVAMEALDERLGRAGLVDGRLLGPRLAEAIAAAPAVAVTAALTAERIRARWLLSWEPAELAWWRALDEKLAPAGGWARVALPSFDRPLEGARDRDPLEVLAEEVASGLDAAPETETVTAVLGDLSGAAAAPISDGRVRLVAAADLVAQARAAAQLVTAALDAGAAVERVAIAVPVLDERTVGPLRRAQAEAAVIAHESRGAPPSSAPVVAAAVHALETADHLERTAVAHLLTSGYVDGPRLVPALASREAAKALLRIARALESKPTAAGPDAVGRLFGTAAPSPEDAPMLDAIVATLVRARAARTRGEQVVAARALWAELGVGARAGRGGLATFASDEPPDGVARAERLAIARDARAWDALTATLDSYEQIGRAAGALEQAVEHEVFRAELVELLDANASQPGAGRASAVRVARLAELAGEELDLLVVIDANEGVLPRDESQDALVSDALASALGRASRGAFAVPAPGQRRSRDLAALAVAAAAARSVVLTFSREDAAGARLEPSFVVDGLARAGVQLESMAAEPAPHAHGDAVARATREHEREGFFLDPARPRSAAIGDLVGSDNASAVTAVLTAESGGGDRSLSVTALERFARCPFMGFAYVVLAAREADTRDELPDAREEGSLVHEALAAAFTATRDLWPRRPRDEAAILDRGLAAADQLLASGRGHAPLRAVLQLRVRDAVVGLLRAALADDSWNFALAEQAFGPTRRAEGETAPWPALEINDEAGRRLALRGKIDRVDLSRDGTAARVVDYKRSKTTVRDASSSLGETALQVPLYACVVSRRMGTATSGTYLPFQPRDIPTDARPNAKLEQAMAALVQRVEPGALAEVERRALVLVGTIRGGALAPLPTDESACRTCAVSGGCRKPRFAMTPAEDADDV